ncbi:hypothetical protein [Pseudomonas sp. Teo4]|uniref:hypothetical protein n=1 Tax=Pseudomonas sp. Teo4 TaxID=3064528 RepID=UPI002AB8CC66|nr:hypothetical protein [Pseudomonas sp. Teo4]MDZ3993338.1 hypothetical protein [Pseudomonas sp. Teo4]
MSGSDGKLFRDYTAGAPTETACDRLYLQTQLASPKHEVVEQITVGDILQMTVGLAGSELSALAVWNGHVAGGIASPKAIRLITCIQNGTNYVAVVTAKIGGQVALKISPVKQE